MFIVYSTLLSYFFAPDIEQNDAFTANLEINKSVSNANPPTGEIFTYSIQYRCASLTDDCNGVVITDPLPSDIEYIGLAGSPHTVNETYNSGSHTVTFTFQNTLTAGSTGEVQIFARYINGGTANGTTRTNTATISATNAASVSSSVSNTAYASSRILFEKYLSAGGAAGGTISYGFKVCNDNHSGTDVDSTLDIENIYIIDTLPAGTSLLSTSLSGGSIISYDAATNIIHFSVPDRGPGECRYPKLTLSVPSPTFSAGDILNNTAYLYLTPVGESERAYTSTYNHTLSNPTPALYSPTKISGFSSRLQGEYGNYELDFELNGTEQLNDFCMIDNIPAGIEIVSFAHGGYYYGGLYAGDDIVTITYTTNLNGPQVITGSPFNRYLENDVWIDVENDLGLVQGGPEYITSISWCYGDMPAGFGMYENVLLSYQVRLDAPTGIATNCVEFTSSTPGAYLEQDCKDVNIIANTNGAIANPRKIKLDVPASGFYNPGDTITYQVRAMNDAAAGTNLSNPVLLDLLSEDLEYVPGSWYIPGWSQTLSTSPIFTQTDNYNGTGRTLLSWAWTGAAASQIVPNGEVNIVFDVVIKETALGGVGTIENKLHMIGDGVTDCYQVLEVDTYDVDGDGNTTENLCFHADHADVNTIVSLESEKLVIGQLDTVWTKYPATASTVPGGIADYQLVVRNNGNVQLDSIIVIDILPFVGDEGVIDLSARNSRWRPNLVGSVSAPDGVTVYYSIENNPCRSSEGIEPSGPAGCATPNWTITPPSDITTVQSLKFDFGATILNPGDSLVLEWPMRAPVNALATIGAQPDSIAWNSFAYIGQRVDNSDFTLAAEPIKVGIEMNLDVPAVIGDWVWIDANNNGLQNGGEVGYDGMRVELFKDNGDGISNPVVDTFVNFTVTADGGYYLFPYLPSGDYFLVFYKPAPFGVTTANAGSNDAIDSDGVLSYYNGFEVAITPVTNLSGTEYDLDWDLGIYPNGLAAIGNYVWADTNNDGIQNEPSSNGINGVTVNLYDNANPGTIYATTVTANDFNGDSGYYLFDQLPPGNYFVEFVLPASTTFTNLGSNGSSDPLDSDANTTTGRTEVFSLAADVFDNSWDAGLILSGTEVCGNGIDDDLDGAIDEDCPEICNDGIDNDGDGLVDCYDCEDCFNSGACNDNDGDGIGDYCDIDDDNDGIPDTDECYVAPTEVTTPVNVLFNSALNGTSNEASGRLATLNRDCLDPLMIDFEFISTGGDIPNLAVSGSRLNLQVQYGGGLSGTSQITYTFSEALSIRLSLGSNASSESVTFITPYDNIIPGAGSTIESTNPVVWNNGNNGASTIFEFLGVKQIILGLEGSSLNQNQRMQYYGYMGNASCCDTDSDGIPDYLDLDADNDGIYDAYEAGHSESVGADGRITGATTGSGTNGLFDALETVIDNDILNYSIADSENSNDGIYDPYELDSDDDGCFDAKEESVSDPDNDGIAGNGTPTVDSNNGLVTSITYTPPPNNLWQDDSRNSCLSLSGTIFEDINYGGGDGRRYATANTSAQASGWANNDIRVPGARVELYDNSGAFVTAVLSNSIGEYLFSDLAIGTYTIRVVNNTVSSNRTSNATGETIIPIQTFRTDNVTDVVNEIGGANPAVADADANTSNANLSALTTGSTTAQSLTSITLNGTDRSDIDFGFNFDVVVNTNDTGQGSLRQFILNANELDNTNLDQEDSPGNGVAFPKNTGWETSIFMIPANTVHTIEPLSTLPSIEDPFTHISAYTQAGAAQGSIASRTINVELFGNGNNYDGLTIYASDVQISGFAIHSFRKGVYANRTTSTNNFIWGNYIGTEADGLTAASNSGSGIDFRNITNSAIGTNGDNINDANEGNIISNSYYGIDTRNGINLMIAGNHVGLDKTGTVDFGNQYVGVYLGNAAAANYVGFRDDLTNTNADHFRNVISGNGNDAIRISDADNQVIAGNYLGTNVSGTSAIENENYGIQLQGSVSNNVIGTNSNGDDDLKERNIISGNGTGLRFLGSSSGSGNVISGNFIGTDVTGNIALPNQNNGLDLDGAVTGTVIGTNGDNTNDSLEGNVISGNDEDGIRLDQDNTIVAGNNIGVGYDGTTVLGNGKRGILVTLTASDNIIGYDASMANSNELVIGNKIMNNDDSGIGFSGTGTQNRVSRNQLENNSGLGIDLDYDLVSANDNGDGDSGPNNLLNFPVLESARLIGNNLVVQGFAPAGSEIEFFIVDAGPNPDPLPSGYTSSFGEGARYLFTVNEGSGSDTDGTIDSYTDDGTGATSTKNQNRFEVTIDTTGFGLTNGINITSTATDANNNTSEFSGWTSVVYIEVCDDGVDNDGDFLTDCEDPDCDVNVVASSNSPICFGNDINLNVSSGVSYNWSGPNSFASTDQNPIINNAVTLNDGIYSVTVTNTSGCTGVATVEVVVTGCTEDCTNGIDDDGDGLIDCADCDDCLASSNCVDTDGDGVGDFCDLDDDNDGIPDSDECSSINLGPELVVNGDFENAYANWTSDFNRGRNNNAATRDGCSTQGWVAVSPCATFNGVCNPYYEYNGGTFDGSIVITDPYGTGANVIPTSNCNATANACLAQILPDHTTGTGLSLYIDPSDVPGRGYWQQIVSVEAGKVYLFSAWIMVIEEDPNLQFRINGVNLTSGFNLDRLTPGVGGPDLWQEVSVQWYSNSISGNVLIELVNLTAGCGGNDIRLDDVSLREVISDCDCDNDGVSNQFDLDSDNDGIYDLIEAGHGALDLDNNGVIDNADIASGNNGLFDNLEVVADNGVINYTISDSESTPDGIYDSCETDSDGDGCYDTDEENITDTDENGIAGTGTPTVDTSGLVTSITYIPPTNNYWQNPLVGSCLSENCSDGLDNDTDGFTDCNDPDCIVPPNIIISANNICPNDIVLISSSDAGLGATYSWDFGDIASPSSISGIGPHSVVYDECGSDSIFLTVQRSGCTLYDTLVINIIDNIAPTFTTPADITVYYDAVCNIDYSPILTGDVIDENDNCASNLDATYVDDLTGLTSCNGTGTIIRTWSLVDSCSNTTTRTQQIVLRDTISPVWSIDPVNIIVECDGTADPRGEISSWLSSFGGVGMVNDACGSVTVTNDYTTWSNSGCGATGSVDVIFTATDDCGRATSRIATLTIVDSTVPEISSVSDITVDCNNIPDSITPSVADSCDTDVDIVHSEVIVYHPNENWKSIGNCNLLYSILDASYNNNSTPSNTLDDTMIFIITVIGQNTGANWSASINGNSIMGEYYKTYQFGPLPSNGSILNFVIQDSGNASCTENVTIDATDF